MKSTCTWCFCACLCCNIFLTTLRLGIKSEDLLKFNFTSTELTQVIAIFESYVQGIFVECPDLNRHCIKISDVSIAKSEDLFGDIQNLRKKFIEHMDYLQGFIKNSSNPREGTL